MSSNMDESGRTGPAIPGYEARDVNTSAVFGFLVLLSVILGLVFLGARTLFRHYSISQWQPAPASSFFDVRQVPVEPDLQVNARADLLKTYARQQQELETYAWEDHKSGVVRIPIERAMDLLLMKGLPVVSEDVRTKVSGNFTPRRPAEAPRAPSTTGQTAPARR
jgi:hypothetical protein